MSSTNHDVNLILKARDEASAKLNKVNSTIKKVAAGIIGYFSARAITGFLKSSVAAFSEQERVVRGLSDALESVGEAADLKRYEAFASYMQKITTYGDEAILSTMKLGVTIGGLAGKDLEAATVAAIGLSKAFNLDLNAAMTLVGKAAAGNFGAFSRMGITFREGMTDAEKYAEVLERGAAGFRIAQGETDTFRGILDQLKNAWGDAKESLGEYIANNETLRGVVRGIQVAMENFGTVMQLVWTNAALNMTTFWEDLKHIFTVQIPTVLDYWAENWKTILTDQLINGATMLENLGTNFRDFFTALVGYFKGEGWNFEFTGLTEGFQRTVALLPDIAKREMTEVEKALAEEAAGYAGILQAAMDEKKNSSFSAEAAMLGAGMGNNAITKPAGSTAETKSGWTLFESRTAGGAHIQSPESRKLDRMIELLAKIADRGSREERKEAYLRTGNPQLLLTNFR